MADGQEIKYSFDAINTAECKLTGLLDLVNSTSVHQGGPEDDKGLTPTELENMNAEIETIMTSLNILISNTIKFLRDWNNSMQDADTNSANNTNNIDEEQ